MHETNLQLNHTQLIRHLLERGINLLRVRVGPVGRTVVCIKNLWVEQPRIWNVHQPKIVSF